MTTVANDLVCPITLELPWDPVTAEDGRVYERSAIEQHIAIQGRNLKSPMTNARMGKRLLPAPQTKNVIESLIASGVLSADLVAKWNEKVNEKNVMEDLLKKADNGDAEAMCRVGDGYLLGRDGFKKDYRLAFSFYSKGHDGGNTTATAMLGQCFLFGDGVAKRNTQGFMYIGTAAGKGSRFAAWLLAHCMAEGWDGLEVDKKEAIRLIRVVVEGKCAVNDIVQEDMVKAQELLDKLTGADN